MFKKPMLVLAALAASTSAFAGDRCFGGEPGTRCVSAPYRMFLSLDCRGEGIDVSAVARQNDPTSGTLTIVEAYATAAPQTEEATITTDRNIVTFNTPNDRLVIDLEQLHKMGSGVLYSYPRVNGPMQPQFIRRTDLNCSMRML